MIEIPFQNFLTLYKLVTTHSYIIKTGEHDIKVQKTAHII